MIKSRLKIVDSPHTEGALAVGLTVLLRLWAQADSKKLYLRWILKNTEGEGRVDYYIRNKTSERVISGVGANTAPPPIRLASLAQGLRPFGRLRIFDGS